MRRPEIKITQTGIGGILKSFTLKVPSHQREYSWTKKEVNKLFQDLTKAISDNDPEYFLGTVVTIPDSGGVLEVIDGQQRLATVTILLSQIRYYLADKDEFISRSVEPFLDHQDRKQRTTRPRLKLNLVDNDYFGKMLAAKSPQERPEATRISHRLIEAAFDVSYSHIKKIVAGFDEKDHGDLLNKWITYIEESTEVILLQIPTGANSFKMFETLNARGLETTQADLVKSYLFEQAEVGDRLPEAQESWTLIRGALDPLQDEEDITVKFLRHALIAIQGPITKEQVYDVIQKRAKGTTPAVTFLRQIESLAGVYTATFFSDSEKWSAYPDAMRLAIKTVNFFNIHPFRPCLLSIASKFVPKEALKAYEMFISLGVRLIIASSTSSGSVEEALHPAASKIFDGTITTAAKLRSEISSIIPSDERFRQAFEGATVSKSSLARYYLRALERVVKKEPTPWFNLNDDKEMITLEHILPEKPEGNWPQFTKDEAAIYYRRIGNMVLHSKKVNSELKSGGFSEKRPRYEDCPYELTSQVGMMDKWTKELICERQGQLAQLAITAWPI